jgi:hypothetical protein
MLTARSECAKSTLTSSSRAFVLTFCFALAFMGVMGCKDKGTSAAASDPNKLAKIGESVLFGDSDWTVVEVKDAGKKLKANSEYGEEKATDGRFVQVHYRVTNKGKKEEHILDTPKVVDAKGRVFAPIEMESFYVPAKTKSLGLEALPPSQPKDYWTVVEVPGDATGLAFQIHGLGLFGDKKTVDLGI